MKKVSIALIGVNGYGEFFLQKLFPKLEEKNVEITGLITRDPQKCTRYQECIDRGITFYKDLDDFYENSFADLLIVSTPISLHAPMTCYALSKGSSVLCEKPIAGSSEDALKMIEAEKNSDGFVAIGYQWSFSKAITDLKKDILSGVFGKPKLLKSLALWPRAHKYYTRNNWAGSITSPSGDIVLDSPVNNATAHYLNNMLFILGDTLDSSAEIDALDGELYRVNDIENYDTAALKIKTTDGDDILFFASHAVETKTGPLLCYEYENGTIYFDDTLDTVKAVMDDGTIKSYGNPTVDSDEKIWHCVDKIRGERELIQSGIMTALPHLQCVEKIQSDLSIKQLDNYEIANADTDPLKYVKSIETAFTQAFNDGDLPKNLGLEIN